MNGDSEDFWRGFHPAYGLTPRNRFYFDGSWLRFSGTLPECSDSGRPHRLSAQNGDPFLPWKSSLERALVRLQFFRRGHRFELGFLPLGGSSSPRAKLGGGEGVQIYEGHVSGGALRWVWLKIKQEGQTAGFGPCFHLPGFHFGTGFLSHSQVLSC